MTGIDDKLEYRKFCHEHPEVPVFMQDYWLDAVCYNGEWGACLSRNSVGEVVAVLPYFLTRKLGLKLLRMPDLTHRFGLWISPKAIEGLDYKIIVSDLISQLPKASWIAQKHPVQLKNWLPFYWKGFKQTTVYTYLLKTDHSEEQLFQAIKPDARNKIRKAERLLTVSKIEDLGLIYQVCSKTFSRQSLKVPFSFSFFKGLDDSLADRNKRSMLIAKDRDGNIRGGIYLVWDDHKIYNLLLGSDSKYRSSGVSQLLLWKAILFAKQEQKIFDFEGSMMENIEPIFRAFGGDLVPYFKIYKGRKWALLINSLR